MALTQVNGGMLDSVAQQVGFRNRIINGAMQIDQRNAGASVTATTSAPYTVDRWMIYGDVNSKFTAQQNAGSVTPPSGFKNYLGLTSSSAYSVPAGEIYVLQQKIEGLNAADLGWGAAGASTVTLSFWVRSSLTGTFGGSIKNSDGSRSYPFSYTISAAGSWEQKSITITGDTSGTWLTTNGVGLNISFGMGVGSTYSGTAGAWASANYLSATGATSVVGTNGATFYITGVQLEKGSTATSFDYRPYGTELALCQRYFNIWNHATNFSPVGAGGWTGNSTQSYISIPFPVAMRSAPTLAFGGTVVCLNLVGNDGTLTSINNQSSSTISGRFGTICSGATSISAGQATWLQPAAGLANYISASAEL